ncbi:hypothetical protein TYRP_020139, partial [Tyrophagus putrescentiae]
WNAHKSNCKGNVARNANVKGENDRKKWPTKSDVSLKSSTKSGKFLVHLLEHLEERPCCSNFGYGCYSQDRWVVLVLGLGSFQGQEGHHQVLKQHSIGLGLLGKYAGQKGFSESLLLLGKVR